MTGLFITLEGPEGAGKSTNREYLAELCGAVSSGAGDGSAGVSTGASSGFTAGAGAGGCGAGDAGKHPRAAQDSGVSMRLSRCPAHAQCVQPPAGRDAATIPA